MSAIGRPLVVLESIGKTLNRVTPEKLARKPCHITEEPEILSHVKYHEDSQSSPGIETTTKESQVFHNYNVDEAAGGVNNSTRDDDESSSQDSTGDDDVASIRSSSSTEDGDINSSESSCTDEEQEAFRPISYEELVPDFQRVMDEAGSEQFPRQGAGEGK
ncbi:hypothetical protein BJV82DRAFT_670215 [Fennellomyces sp. T-0311]|nr:hypothetical protein BJV82DRAFT_670215 [Fennellomyces sp. T-0311]